MDGGRQATSLVGAFTAARAREANGALIAIRAGMGDARGPAVIREILDRVPHDACPLEGASRAFLLPSCSASEARAAAEAIRQALSPAPVAAGIADFYEFFFADGTPAEIAREIGRTALRRLEAIERRGGGIADATDASAPAEERRPVVALVEPDPVSVELLAAGLDAAGFEVRSFQNGEAAFFTIQASPPVLVISEAMTPRLNGFAIRDRLRADPRLAGIPFILVSHRKTEEMIRRAVEADIRHFFRKPLSVTEIVGLAQNLARSPS